MKIPGERAASYARIGGFGVADQTGVVNVLMGQTDVGSRNQFFPIGRIASLADLTPILRSIILVRQSSLGEAFDFQFSVAVKVPESRS